jgi:hypothetical protein
MLYVKKSKIPKSGKGLFTTHDIKKGEVVCEYEGEKLTWKECLARNNAQKGKGGYYFYINSKNCVDAQYTLWALAGNKRETIYCGHQKYKSRIRNFGCLRQRVLGSNGGRLKRV